MLVLVELLHDYISRSEHLGRPLQPSLRSQGISEFAASVINKINTLLLSQDLP